MTTIELGKATIQRVEEMTMTFPIASVSPDAAFVDANKDWLIPHFLDPEDGTFVFTLQSWLLHLDGRTIVIDPCNGNGRTLPDLPYFDHLETPYLERFEATGTRPQDVDIVFCTHLHCDHCGWNTKLQDGRFVPTFPKARYIFVRREFERWDPNRPNHMKVDYNAGVFEDSVLPIYEAGLADLVSDRHDLAPGLTVEPAYGHTFGHSLLHVSSGGKEALFTGDAFHHPLQVLKPELDLGGCDNLEGAVATRRRLRERCAATGALMLPAHFPAPHCGHIERRGDDYAFKALSA